MENTQQERKEDVGVEDSPIIKKLENARRRLPIWLRTPSLPDEEISMQKVLRAVLLEYMATTLFVFYACASVVAANAYYNQTVAANLFAAIVQGFAIATFVYAISHTSGGHINPAVTFALMISKNIGVMRGLVYIIAQLIGGITGAALLSGFLPGDNEGQLGTTTLSISRFQGFLFEFLLTFSLIFTIFGTALNKEAAASGLPSLAPLPIGFSVIIGVGIAYGFTGGSLNPARTFGPAVISHTWDSHYVYWAGPMGAGLVVGLLERYFCLFSAGQRHVIRHTMQRRREEMKQRCSVVALPIKPEPAPTPLSDPEPSPTSSGSEEEGQMSDNIELQVPPARQARRGSAIVTSPVVHPPPDNTTRRRSINPQQQDTAYLSVPIRGSPTMHHPPRSPKREKKNKGMSLVRTKTMGQFSDEDKDE